MTKQIINIGTSANKGNGDPLRTAFTKVNANFDDLYAAIGTGITAGATAPAGPVVGDLWYDANSGRTYIYYDSSWVDASPVDGAGISSTNELVNGAHTVSLSSAGLTAFPAISNESLFIQASELGSANASIGISAKNNVIVTADILDTAKQWTFGTEGKLTLPAGTTYEYVNVPLTGHGDGLARLDFTLVTDGVNAQWAAASASPAGSGYSPGDTFTFNAAFLGIPGASVTIEVLTVGAGGSVENLAFTQPPLYPADIYRDSPINLQVGPESNRWTFGASGDLTVPGDIQLGADSYLRFPDSSFQGTAFVGDATRLYGNLDQNVDVIARSTPATVTATTTADTDPFIGQFEISLGLDAVQAGWEMNTGTEQSPIWTTVTNASLNPGEYWIYLASGFEFQFSLSTAYTFRNPALLPKTWTFDTNGLLTFPNGSLTMGHGMGDAITSTGSLSIYAEGGLGLSCDPTGPNLSQINLGDQGNINIRSLTASGEKYWYFNSDGTLTGPGGKLSLPPNGKITSGVGAQIGYQAVIATDLYGNTTTGEVGGSTVVNVGSNAQLLALIDPASEFGGSQYNLLSPITITYSDNTTQTFSSVRSTNIVTGSVIVFGSNSDTTAGHNFPITLETANYAPAYTAPEWTFGIDGALTFPDNLTVVNGIIGKASTATITEGEASQTTAIESQIEITTTGVVIAKRTSVTVNDGVTTTVNDNGSTLELDNTHASITYYIEPDGPDNNSLIQFTTDSSAGGGATIETVTEDVGGTAHGRVRAAGNSVQVSAKTFLGTNKTWSFTGAGDLQLPESGNILSNGANYIDLANFETSYNDAEGAYQDALTAWMTLETFRPVWFALPGRLAYDEMIAWTPTTGQPALPLNLPPVAKNAQDSYAAWQETIALSKLTVASDIAEFDFNSTGKLRLPQGGTVGGGDQAAIDTAYDEWQADEAGWQYLITTGGADLNVRPWNFAGPSRAEKQAVVLSMWQAQQSGDTIDWVPISSAFYNEARAWLAFTANQDGYENWKKLTTSINITSDDKTWTFTNDGALTFPDGTTTTGESITVPVDQSLTVNTSYSMGPGGATTFKISPEHIKLPTGNGVIFSGTETAANSWGLDSANKTLYFPDAGDGVNPQIYYSKVDGVTGMELMTYAKSIKITAAQTSSWTFGADGTLALPATSSILTNETALNIATHPTTTYTFNQAYWAALNGNTARIFTPTFNAQYFACTVTANQNGAYTVAVTGTGNGFVSDNWFKIPGNELGGTTPANDMQITIATVDGGGGILTTTITGTAVSKQWQFSTTGSLTLPDASVIASYKPVTVIAATTTPQTITDNASAAFIQFVETVDTAGAFSPGTFTAPYTGYYQINMSVYFSTIVSLTSTSFLLIDTNLDFTKQVRIIDGGWTGSYLHYSTVISATAGDAIRVAFRQVSGGDVEISSGSRLTIHRVSIS